jgi:hypothetical protein
MNYVELNLGGKKRGAKFGIGFLRMATEGKKMSLDELFKRLETSSLDNTFLVLDLLYYSLKYNSMRKKEEFDYEIDDISEWLDEQGGLNAPVTLEFLNALRKSLIVEDGNNEEGKPKPQKKVAK